MLVLWAVWVRLDRNCEDHDDSGIASNTYRRNIVAHDGSYGYRTNRKGGERSERSAIRRKEPGNTVGLLDHRFLRVVYYRRNSVGHFMACHNWTRHVLDSCTPADLFGRLNGR